MTPIYLNHGFFLDRISYTITPWTDVSIFLHTNPGVDSTDGWADRRCDACDRPGRARGAICSDARSDPSAFAQGHRGKPLEVRRATVRTAALQTVRRVAYPAASGLENP